MTLTTTVVDRWQQAFAALDRECPWPGPRPLVEDDVDEFGDAQQVLVGRERDRRNFLREVDTGHRLIFLTGQSGVGKTSLLQVGLVPVLRENGYRVAVCRDWTRDDDSTTPAEFLAAKVRDQLLADLPDLAHGADMFWDLDRAGGVVLVLDQFEELLRWDRPMQRGIFALINDLNQAAPEIKLVVSFRSEFLHEMRPLESSARAFSMSHFALEPLDPAYALELVTAPNRAGREVVTAGAAATIAARWCDAVGATDLTTADARSGIGLLHLQALLYALHAEAPGGVITQDQVDDLPDDAVHIFIDGLARAAEVKLERCRRASTEAADVDPYLLEGATDLLARCVRHLSSAGYKLVREVVDLAHVTFGDQLASLVDGIEESGGDVTPEQLRALLCVLVDVVFGACGSVSSLLAADRREVARLADARCQERVLMSWNDRLENSIGDPTGATSGPMLDMAPAAVLVEEIRRFVFALAWLDASCLVRVSRPGNETMVSLVHDGFGAALASWSALVTSRPDGALHALTAARGAFFKWDDVEPGQVLVNLRWRGNTVAADFTRVTFVNCDFRGTLFLGCVLTGVSFVNCMLDGAIFSDCAVRGVLERASGECSPHEPSFVVTASERTLTALSRYRGDQPGARTLFSPSQGRAAVAVAEPPTAQEEFLGEAGTSAGGLVIVGGRVSSFMFRRCFVEGESMVSFRHVAGSGLDVVDQASGGRYEFYGSAVRHVSFTSSHARDEDRIDVVAEKSLIAQSWLAEPITGTFHASDCRLVQVWNGSRSLRVTAERSSVMGCVGVEDGGGCLTVGDTEGFVTYDAVDQTGELRIATSRMDYRAY